ncbi:Unconventional myosin-IXa [Frankliniella fusca]|uniref:Unconventional myosin-IXa n=1 Tax=Frankliniella fusca TaxID=407009 RepID=A0AAE1GZU3_9NEOP|nr:Unconventional myosin-IXa [Frankliniella fusca]
MFNGSNGMNPTDVVIGNFQLKLSSRRNRKKYTAALSSLCSSDVVEMAALANNRYIVQVFVGSLSQHYEALSVEASKQTTSDEIVSCIVERLSLAESAHNYELAEVVGDKLGQECKERRLGPTESPVALMLLWPKESDNQQCYRFCLREKINEAFWENSFSVDPQLIKDYFQRFLYQPQDREYPDLCQLPDLNEQTLLDNLRARFSAGHIYTYVGSILIAVNPFKFHPIYNPKYVKLYQNRRLGSDLPPHIFAVADAAYHCMLREKRNQCVVISGESGSGKTESTNFLLHHLTALSQKGSHGSGVEQTILSAGPVLEAFGNAKTAHNNNSSRFGKFIQVNYKENGMVHGAVVQKYLLEKSRICSQGRNERNYHVFYYLLAGASEVERQLLHLKRVDQYNYLNRSGCFTLDNVDEKYEFSRLRQSMEMVGFTLEKQRRLFAVLSAVLLLGNVEFQPRKSAYHHDESVAVKNPEVVRLISDLLRVKQETLLAALTAKRARASGETLIINYRLPEAIAARDAIAKCLYGALFDWIVLQVNHALLSKKDTLRDHQGNSIGVLDIFGFEDFGLCNSFEQFCINYANEHLQYYFNQHVFKYEQEEYRKEGISWTDIDFMDNTGCLQLIEGKPSGLLCVLDDQCNFPGATNETLLQKFNSVHKENTFYEVPQKWEAAFIIRHYAGKVKYQASEMREKNLDLMRQDIVGVLKNSSMAFVRELVGADPVAVFRWAIVRAFFRGYFAFHEAGKRHRQERGGTNSNYAHLRSRNHTPNENIISFRPKNKYNQELEKDGRHMHHPVSHRRVATVISDHSVFSQHSSNNRNHRLSWPQFNLSHDDDKNNSSNESKSSLSGCKETDSKWLPTSKCLCPDEAEVMNRANQIVMKNKSFRPRERGKKGLKNLQTVKTLAGRTQSYSQQPGKARKQPMTVTAQFQQSLHSLMDTLNQANPFFIRCIKSNGDKIPNKFDEETVQRQLRYTGMLETVRIRQAGYNVRLTYDEFIQLYRILLPRGLKSSHTDVRTFLLTLNLNRDNYQTGESKMFLRECEKQKLDIKLHRQIIAAIISIQRWFRGILERRKFLRVREAALTIQSFWRLHLSERNMQHLRFSAAATVIQKNWRAYQTFVWFRQLKTSLVNFQAYARGYLARQRLHAARNSRQLSKEISQEEQQETESTVFYDDSDTDNLGTESLKRNFKPSRHHRVELSDTLQHNTLTDKKSTDSRDEVIGFDWKYSKRKLPPKQKLRSKTDTLFDSASYVVSERKGSCDSLASQRSSDSQSSTTVRETLHVAKKQIQAFIGGKTSNKKLESCSHSAQSDSEIEENHGEVSSVWKRRTGHQPISRQPHVTQTHTHSHFGQHTPGAQPVSPVHPIHKHDVSELNPRVWQRRALRDSNGSSGELKHEPEAPTRMARRRDLICRSIGEEYTDGRSKINGTPPDNICYKHVNKTVVYIQFSFCKWCSLPDDPPPTSEGSTSKITVWPAKAREILESNVDSGLPFSTSSGPQVTGVAAKRNRSSGAAHSHSSFALLDLKRRNSDPANQIGLPQTPPKTQHQSSDILEWKGTTMFTIANHSFRKQTRFAKEDRCAFCSTPMDAFVTQGFKCSDCKQIFHTKCIQNGGVLQMPCPTPHPQGAGVKPGRRKPRKNPRAPSDSKAAVESRFSLTGTSQFTDSQDKIISDAKELQSMHDFINSKVRIVKLVFLVEMVFAFIRIHPNNENAFVHAQIYKMESLEGQKPSRVDRVFKQALREFKDNLVATYSVVNKQGPETLNIKYKDLIANFMHVMETVCNQENSREDFPVTMGVNAFRGFMNEFMNRSISEKEKPGRKRKKEKDKDKKRRGDEPIRHGGHIFMLTIINIPTACEVCSSFFMWPIERGLVCQNCKLTCHKKCYLKVSSDCGKEAMGSSTDGVCAHKIFGTPLHQLVSGDIKVPIVVDRLITTIEMYGLYTEGIYRKSGVTSKVRELKARLEASGDGSGSGVHDEPVDFETYPVHVLASVLKCFLREMPEPLLTFDCYDDFLRAANLTEPADRVSTLFAILKKLPKPNFDLMERLIFHLARVALHEDANRMSPSALAIVFAPCVLRTNKVVPAQDSLTDISRQTQCIETIISEQLRKVRSTLADIDTLDEACHTATHRLSSLRSSKIFSPEELLPELHAANRTPTHDEEAMLVGHIQEMEKEKALLTSALPSLTRASSDDDLLSTDMDDGSLDDGAEMESEAQSLVGRHHRRILSRTEDDHGPRQYSADGTLKQSSSSHLSVTSRYSSSNDCDEDPIMV